MIKASIILVSGLLMFSACKPQELNVIKNLSRRVRVSTVDGFVYAELANEEDKIFRSNEKMYAWYEKGQINDTQGDYSGKLLNGQYIAYYAANKQLKEKGRYTYGLKRGKWLAWRPDGTLAQSQRWNLGLKSGKTIMYDSLGKEKQQLKYRSGVILEKKKKGIGFVSRMKEMFKKKKK